MGEGLNNLATPHKRVLAKLVDLFVVLVLSILFWYPIGPFVGLLYSLFADGLDIPKLGLDGQSFGKKLIRLQTIAADTGRPVRWRRSVLRNLPLSIMIFFALVPIWGWFIAGVIGVPLSVLEIFLMIRAPFNRRLGDLMAETRVIDLYP